MASKTPKAPEADKKKRKEADVKPAKDLSARKTATPKKAPSPRKSKRSKSTDDEHDDEDDANMQVSSSDDDAATTTPKRSATKRKADADSKTPSPKKRRLSPKANKTGAPLKGMMALSALLESEREIVMSVANSLGEYSITAEMEPEVTHLVIGSKKRTLKLLEALARGIWIVHVEWITKGCLDAQRWVPEDKYEAHDWFPGAQRARLARRSPSHPGLLDGHKIYIIGSTQPTPDDLERIILDCGGEVVHAFRDCTLAILSPVASRPKQTTPPKPMVSVEWLIDALLNYHVRDPYEVEWRVV